MQRGGEFALRSADERERARDRLREAEDKVCRRKKIKRENHELNRDPEHERNAEHAAENFADFFAPEKQRGRREIGKSVDDEKGNARKNVVLKERFGERQHLKKGKQTVHSEKFARWIDEHQRCAVHRADTDKKRPENERAAG